MEILHNLNIERTILSSVLFYPSLFEEVASVLKPSDFYLPAHRYVFEAMNECEREDLPIDEEFVQKKLKQASNFNEDVMIEIVSTSPIQIIKPYINETKEKSVKRELVKLSSDITNLAVEQDLPVKEVVDSLQQKLYSILQEANDKDFKDTKEMVEETLERIKQMKAKGNSIIVGLDTGFYDLNKITAGFGDGDLIIIAARPAMGKTSFCLNLAQNVLNNNKGVAIFSLEMPSDQLMLRMLSAKTSIPLQKLRVGDLNDEQWAHLTNACDDMTNTKLFVDDNGYANIHYVRSKLRKLKTQYPEISLCIIDYLQMMLGAGNKDRHLEVSDISRGLKLLARELEMPIIALSQLNRGLESRNDKRPMLSDLRESGAIEQDADMILFVYRDDVYRMREEQEKEKKAKLEGNEYRSKFIDKPEEDAEIIVGKNRNGPIGHINLIFQKALTKFTDKNSVPIETIYEGEAGISSIEVPGI